MRDRKAPTPGNNLALTLDADLQRVASDAMAGLEGAIVAIEPSTGDILALVSTPSFDPDVFGHSVDPDDYQKLIRDAKNPLLNRAIQGQYAPGSTIKPFVALAGLESGHAVPDKQFFAPPQFKIPNYRRPFRDWKDEGHGWVTVSSSITQSCDVYFYSLAYHMGIEALESFLAQFGLGQVQQLDLPGERPGLLPNETWKQKMYGQPWYPGETVIMGIGQGYLLLTPLQLATATAALATRGIRMKPRLLRAYEQDGEIIENPPEELGRVTLSDPAWWDLVTNAMVDVVHAENGTARRSGRDAAYRIAGKTGTAQVINYGEKRPDSEDLPEHIRDHSLFIAFAPAEAPEIALAVIVEHGGHGSTMAAPIARQVPGRLPPEGPVMAQHFYTSAVSRLVKPLDRTLMALLLAVLALSLTIQYSANDMSLQATQQHAIRIGIGLLALMAMAHIAPRHLRRWAPALFLLNLLLLVAVVFYGSGGTAQRWLSYGPIALQPSELLKLTIPMIVAYILGALPATPVHSPRQPGLGAGGPRDLAGCDPAGPGHGAFGLRDRGLGHSAGRNFKAMDSRPGSTVRHQPAVRVAVCLA